MYEEMEVAVNSPPPLLKNAHTHTHAANSAFVCDNHEHGRGGFS